MNKDYLYLQTLKRYFGYDSFRSIQLDIIRSIGEGHDTLGLMPTGGGKSITFQVPALTMDGVCLVISPLIALMKDQVEHLKARGIKAEAIYSGLSQQDIQRILDNAVFGAVKFLYVSPERLSQELFLKKLYYMKLCFITIDEAHCISQWGYDFRPQYLKIAEFHESISKTHGVVPMLALTATATPEVAQDIQKQLGFRDANVYYMSYRRKNLSYVVRRTEDKFRELLHIIGSVPGCVIVYTRNRENTKELSQMLVEAGVNATYYHAGLDFAIKEKRQAQWQHDEIRVMVCTNAFGMGIDKPDVRLVIHMDCPDSIEAYFQEAGRGGRDGKRSYAVLLYNDRDRVSLLRRITTSFPEKDYIRKVYDDLAYYFQLAVDSGEGVQFDFNEVEFCRRFKHYPQHMERALAILQNIGYISYDLDHDNRPRIIVSVRRNELYNNENIYPNEDKVLLALLRHYGTLFVDFTYFEYGVVERYTGMTQEEIHLALRELARKGIVRYVPPRNMPTITYLRQRVDSDRLVIPRCAYEDLQEHMSERIRKFIKYAEEEEKCRETLLMEYFGEKATEDCGCCDICLCKT